jgi:hypothetical protein
MVLAGSRFFVWVVELSSCYARWFFALTPPPTLEAAVSIPDSRSSLRLSAPRQPLPPAAVCIRSCLKKQCDAGHDELSSGRIAEL